MLNNLPWWAIGLLLVSAIWFGVAIGHAVTLWLDERKGHWK